MNPLAALLSLAAGAVATSPIPGFRPPSVPLISQSPLINVFSPFDTLNEGDVTHWTGPSMDWMSGVYVDSTFYLIMGNPNPSLWNKGQPLNRATQTSLTVFATQTLYTFTAGPLAVNLTFTTPQIAGDWDLMSRPAHYLTYSFASLDASTHDVSVYQDVTSLLVIRDSSANMTFSRVPLPLSQGEALRLGGSVQAPLRDTNDRASWGFIYLSRSTEAPSAGVMDLTPVTRAAFVSGGVIPTTDNPINPQPVSGNPGKATGPQPGKDRSGNDMPGSPFQLPAPNPDLCWGHCNATAGCKAWAYAVPGCDQYAKPTCWLKDSYGDVSDNKCRVSGAQDGWPQGGGATIAAAATYTLTAVGATPQTRVFVVSVDELEGINWFGEHMPPWWRRAMPLNDTTTLPVGMLEDGMASYTSVKVLCDTFDATTALQLSGAGGDEYATVSQLTYRQVWAGQMLVFSPVRNTMWYFLKEISSWFVY